MQHIQKRGRGRPPVAGREKWKSASERLRWFRKYFEGYSDNEHPSNLKWTVPFKDVVEAIQTIGGIARVAGVDRSTVYRNRIKAGSGHALQFVLTRKRKYPLVVQTSTPSAPLHPGSNRLCLHEVSMWADECALEKRSVPGTVYHPIGRVTVAEICGQFGLSRQAFYRWKRGLIPEHRAYLEEVQQGYQVPVREMPPVGYE